MPRIPDEVLKSVFYLYPTAEAAEKGESRGGCGFLVDVRSTTTGQSHRYVVSNIHVVFNGCTFLRLNKSDGKTEVFDIPIPAWWSHDNGDDVAVAQFRHREVRPSPLPRSNGKISWARRSNGMQEWRSLNVEVGDDVSWSVVLLLMMARKKTSR